ncbi:hypothetical protein SAMN03159341_11516 [Paenibacillus sp. 1_12]|uniref:hypothetical protein n=1 Tax=Paenibacillus sp. 1_12 TaxID=1566278 RepID=UPI0008E3D903|nr:hypothetical protein [Paenibacillus sp. 1_12]SFM05349.1 hypothetical protein SAMN03159341_11516 [Paenibacillus sp. 1_12]
MLRADLQDKLLERFPWAESKNPDGTGRGYLAPCWCGDGWFQIIWDMFEELESLYESMNVPINLRVNKIKEKYARMRVYISGDDYSEVLSEVDDIIGKYERLSEATCDLCGEAGIIRGNCRYVKVYCDSCYEINVDSKPVFKYYDANKNLYIDGCLYDLQALFFRYLDVNGNKRVGKGNTIYGGSLFCGIIDPNVDVMARFKSMGYFDAYGKAYFWGASGTQLVPFKYYDNLGNEFIISPVDGQPILLRGFNYQGIINPYES